MDWIGDTYRSDVGWTLLETLVDIGSRMPGSDGERDGAMAVKETFEEIGLADPHLESFSITGWERKDSSLIVDGTDHACIGLPRSPATTVNGQLVDLEYGLPSTIEAADLTGKIALVRSDVPDHHDRYIHRREKYYRAVEAGAAGFIYRNHVPGQLPPTGSVGTADASIGPIPAVGVSAEVGARLARRHDGQPVELSVEATIEDATSQNIHASIGPDTDQRVLVTAHVDAHDVAEGAADNGAGVATVAEIARGLSTQAETLTTGVEFVVFGAEEVGLLGSGELAAQRAETVRAVLNCDAVVAGRDLELYTNGHEGLTHPITDAADRVGHPVTISPELLPHSDHWPFVVRGVPGIMATARTDGDGRGWGHTAADTLDKLDRRNLQEQSIFLTELARLLTEPEYPLSRQDESTIADKLAAQGTAAGMQVTGDWPFETSHAEEA